MNLRPYQADTIAGVRSAFGNGHQRIIMCAPTGAGKTVMFSTIIERAHQKGTTVLVLTDRVELFKQTVRAIGVEVQGLNADTSTESFNPFCTVTVAMVETYKRRFIMGYEPRLIIADEAHKANFNDVYDRHPHALVIGATATPIGKHLFQYFTHIEQSIDIPELVAGGYLAPCRAYQMVDDFTDLKTARGEYTNKSLWQHYDKRKLYDGVVTEWLERAASKKTIVFCVNIEHTIETCGTFNRAGITSYYITSKTSRADREALLEDFAAGAFPVLVNCGILTTGYDEPSIECVIVNRKTKSLSLWLQMVGRGSRSYPGKKYFTLLDFGQNHDEHGRWDQPRTWELKKPGARKEQPAPVKDCPKCDAMLFASATTCNVCGHVFPLPEPDQLATGVMVEVGTAALAPSGVPLHLVGRWIHDLDYSALIELQKSKRYKAAFIWNLVKLRPWREQNDYLREMGYTKWWWENKVRTFKSKNFVLK